MTDSELQALIEYLRHVSMPFTVTVSAGKIRTYKQNALVHMWFGEIAKQKNESPEWVKCECKAWCGIPILRAEDVIFAEWYAKTIARIADIRERIEALQYVPCTSIMTTEQLGRMCDAVFRKYTQEGVILTIPNWSDFSPNWPESDDTGKARLAAVASLPCIICREYGFKQESRTQVHHCIHGRYSTKRAPDSMTIPLCEGHHQGLRDTSKIALHREPDRWRQEYGQDTDWISAVEVMLRKG